MEEKTLGKLSVVMLRCVFWNAPTVYYNIIMQCVLRHKKLSIGTRARDLSDGDGTSSSRAEQGGLEKLRKKFKR